MTLKEFNEYICQTLSLPSYAKIDKSLNGWQVVANSRTRSIKKVALAVDACLVSINQAKEQGADVLFVHHGLFWGREFTVTGRLYPIIKALMENDIVLYTVHLPLDAHSSLGHNARLAQLLGLIPTEPLGDMGGGRFIGCLSSAPEGLSWQILRTALERVGLSEKHRVIEWLYSPRPIQKIGIISGGGMNWWEESRCKGADLFITGEVDHSYYHAVREAQYNVVGLGHYFTERWGMLAMADKIQQDCQIPTCFLEHETYL